MEREISSSLSIAVTLVTISAFISLIFSTVTIGLALRDQATQGLMTVHDSMSLDYARDLTDGTTNTNMPAATAFNILTMYNDVITEEASGYDSTVRNLAVQGSVLKNHLQGRVQLDIVKTGAGTYIAFVHILGDGGSVQDQTQAGFLALKAKYGLS